MLGIGETVDVEFAPAEAGELRLEFRTSTGTIVGVQPIVVRPASLKASTM
jgi:hypothetical protein